MRSFIVMCAGLTLACGEVISPSPGQLLRGSWTDAATSGHPSTLAATTLFATLTTPCYTVRFGPVRLSDSLTFRETGVVTEAGGLITVRTGDPYTIAGHFVGNRVVMGSDTLVPGSAGVRVCNA
jgi:hypothetical protein